MKRVLSVFLTVAMLLCLPVTTFAAEVEEFQRVGKAAAGKAAVVLFGGEL